MEEIKTIKENIQTEFFEKKSRFITHLYQIDSQEMAEEILVKIRKQYYDARHNCYCYRIYNNGSVIERFSDDGEPGGTAGAPMLNAVSKNGLVNILVVVTRYFGGILLGARGLVRAYSTSTLQAIEQAEIIYLQQGYEAEITISYSDIENFKYYCKIHLISILQFNYTDKVIVIVEITEQEYNQIIAKSQELPFEMIQNTILRKKYVAKNTRK